MLRTVLLILMLVSAPTLGAGRTLRIGLASDITSLDPHLLAAQPNLVAARHVFESLVDVDERAQLIPGLAVSWRAVDPLTWEFRLRPGVRFHDGTPLTLEDVIFSLQRPLQLNSPGGFAAYVRAIAELKALDAHTLRVRTHVRHGALPEDLNSVVIVSRRAAGQATSSDFDRGRALIGTGPFRYVSYARGERLRLARHEHYWGRRPAWDAVELRTLVTDPVRTAALVSGQVDAIEQIPSADYARLKRDGRYRFAQTISWRTILLHLDQRPAHGRPYADPRLRAALSHAIDRQALADIVLEGLAVPAANLVSPGVFGHDPTLRPDAYDPPLARRLLTAAGYPGGFTLTVAGPNNRYINDDQVVQALAQMFARAGLQPRVEVAPLNVYLGRARRDTLDCALLGWGSFAGDLALRSLVLTHDPARGHGAWNWGRYTNPTLDALVSRALGTVDRQAREHLVRQAMNVVAADRAVIPLYHQLATWAMRPGLDYVARTDEFTLAQFFVSSER